MAEDVFKLFDKYAQTRNVEYSCYCYMLFEEPATTQWLHLHQQKMIEINNPSAIGEDLNRDAMPQFWKDWAFDGRDLWISQHETVAKGTKELPYHYIQVHIEKEINLAMSYQKQKRAAPLYIHHIMQSYQRFLNVLHFHGLFFFEANFSDFPFLFLQGQYFHIQTKKRNLEQKQVKLLCS